MADDMRNRFLVALVFAVPVFLYSPMGDMFGNFPTPFGMDRKLFTSLERLMQAVVSLGSPYLNPG